MLLLALKYISTSKITITAMQYLAHGCDNSQKLLL